MEVETRVIKAPPIGANKSWHGQWRRDKIDEWRTVYSAYGPIVYASKTAANEAAKARGKQIMEMK